MTDELYCWECGNTGQVREQPFDDLSDYEDCACQDGTCGCGCCPADDYDDDL